jgi:CDP-glucose 4,6-dehydratase
MGITKSFWKGRRVLITGHTGFKGSWLSLLLNTLGAKIYGVALENEGVDSLYMAAKVSEILSKEYFVDIRDADHLNKCVEEINPDVVFHLAAESLVLRSYLDPVKTLHVNIIGTFNVLWAATKSLNNPIVIVATSDKCYLNDGSGVPFHESAPLGGMDPYSASKACAEIVSTSFYYSFGEKCRIKMGTVRAGNVIGGGDWSENRLIPDFFRSLRELKPLVLRSPNSTRPWQHVLEPLIGYLEAAEFLNASPPLSMNSWNFGPDSDSIVSVASVVNQLKKLHPNVQTFFSDEKQTKEAEFLSLDSSHAKTQLGWEPILNIESAIALTSDWYAEFLQNGEMRSVTVNQIENYVEKVAKIE